MPLCRFCGTSGNFLLLGYCHLPLYPTGSNGTVRASYYSDQFQRLFTLPQRADNGRLSDLCHTGPSWALSIFRFVLGVNLRAARRHYPPSFYRSEIWGPGQMTGSRPTPGQWPPGVRPQVCAQPCPGMSCWVRLWGSLLAVFSGQGQITIWNGLVSLLPGGWRMD